MRPGILIFGIALVLFVSSSLGPPAACFAAENGERLPADQGQPQGAADAPPAPDKGGYAIGSVLSWAWKSLTDEPSLTLGYGVRRSSFTFTRKSDSASGTIVDRDYPAYFLIYSTKPAFFESSRFGYTFMLKLSSFDMDRQATTDTLVVGTPVDVHTNVKGIVGYAVPSLFYQWGEHRSTGTFVQAGAGIGLATTTYSGTIELRSPTTSELVNVRDESFSLQLAWSTFLEARWRHWGLNLSIMRAHLPGDTYDSRFEDVSLYLGYRIFF